VPINRSDVYTRGYCLEHLRDLTLIDLHTTEVQHGHYFDKPLRTIFQTHDDDAAPLCTFKISELEPVCPGVSRDMIRHVLREQQGQGAISCSGRGAGAAWSRGDAGNQGNE
jgi:hypothetical protein